VNADGKVNIEDVMVMAEAFGSNVGNSRYNPNADINGDGKINIEDIFIIAKTFGK
jgi:endoglucanase